MKKVFSFILLVFLVVVFLGSVSADEGFPVDARTNCIQSNGTHQKCVQGTEIINALDKDGEWKECGEVLSYEVGDDFIEFDFGAEKMKLEWDYDVKYIGFVNFMKRLFVNVEADAVFDVERQGCNFYFLQNFENDEFVLDELKYKMPKNFEFKDNVLTDTASGLSIDFNQAVEEQNVEIEEVGGDLVFSGENISRLDPTTGFTLAGTGTSAGSGDIAWTNPGNIVTADANYATVSGRTGDFSYLLQGKAFGFSLPASSTIDGIEVKYDIWAVDNEDPKYASSKMLKAGSEVGSSQATGVPPGTRSDITFGGAENKWGTTWTQAEVENAGFGNSLKVQMDDRNEEEIRVYAMWINVHYTAPVGDEDYPLINFTNPTLANATSTSNTSVEINVTIDEANLANVTWNWNGTNYTMYDDSLVLAMNMDSYTRFNDTSTDENDGTCSACPTYSSSGKYNGGYDFDGINDVINIADSSSLSTFTSGLTIALWIKTDNLLGIPISRWGSMNGYGLYTPDQNWYMGTGSAWSAVASGLLTDDAWHHYVLIWNGTDVVSYRDTAYVANNALSSPSFTSPDNDKLEIGGDNRYVYSNFSGSIDEVRIWSRSLSEDEISQQYMSNLAKFNDTHWELYINQSKNVTDGLDLATYTYQTFAEDSSNNFNLTEERTITIGEAAPSINLDLIYPTGNINVTQNEFFNVTVNTSCSGGDCGEVNISLAYFEDNFYSDNTEDEASGTCIDNASAYDENWATYASTSGGCNIYINYTVPSGVINAIVESKHYAEDNGDITNFSCWNYSGEGWEQIFYDDSGPGDSFFLNNTIYPDCMSGSKLMFNVYIEDGFDATFLYEEQVWWNVTSPLFVLVPASGTPFYTNVTNPNTTTLNAEENLLKTFWVNASGVAGTNKSFFVFANTTSDMSVSNITSQFNVTITVLDTTFPLIDYGVITEITNSLANRSWIYVNVSVTEDNEDTITFNLYNNSILVNSTALTDSTRFVNWTGLGVGNYSYNVTVNDSAGNTNYTGTRTIDLMNIAQGCRNIVWKGAYTLVNSTIVNYPSTCMVIDTSDVYFDGQGYTIDGPATTAIGINVVGTIGNELTNVTIINVDIYKFADGISFTYVDDSKILDSITRTQADNGIQLEITDSILINNTNSSGNVGASDAGIYIATTTNSNITNILSDGNDVGIVLINAGADNNLIHSSTFINNELAILTASTSDDNIFYNNFFNNTAHATTLNADNYYNTSLSATTSIIGGTNSGGNYWSSVGGSNYSDTCTVTVTDYICDNPMNVSSGLECIGCKGINIDEHPLSYNVADTTFPLIDYGVITEITNSLANRSWIYVNVSVTEDNEDTITFNLYNNSILVNSTALTDSTRFVNWTGLGVGNYSYNVTVNDSAGNTNYTGTRTIDLMNIAQGCRNIVWKGAYTLVNSTIVNYPSTCMVIDTSDVYFDGQGYTIDGVNTGNGIHVVGSSGNELTNVTINNTFVNDFATGLYFEYTDNSFVFDSNFSSGNSRNIRILYSNNNIFNNLNITDASGSNDQGLELAAADFNNISNSYFNNNNRAIIISTASNNNIILNNTIINSVTIGIKAEAISADNNLIYNNFFNNTNNYNTVAGADNYFNTTLTEETNIIGGANIGGNYWGGIAGNNYSDTCTVTVTDNICDNPMNITDGTECVGCSGKDIDELPLSYNVAGCTYNSECNGDEYCLNSACANLSAGAKFLLKDALGSTVATIDSSGNVGLTGSFNDSNSAVCSASGNNALNINDNAIVRSWINESGGMCIGGALYENAGADLSCANSFIIKDSSGNNKVCISKTSGNLTLSGYLGKNA